MKVFVAHKYYTSISLGCILWLCTLLTGCLLKVKLAGPYDALVDQSVHQVAAKTIAHFKIIMDNQGQNEGAYDNKKAFYSSRSS